MSERPVLEKPALEATWTRGRHGIGRLGDVATADRAQRALADLARCRLLGSRLSSRQLGEGWPAKHLEHGIPLPAELVDAGSNMEALSHLLEFGSALRTGCSATFSAALVPAGSTRIILDNDAHNPKRRRNSVSHEMSHLVLEHEFGQVMLTGDGYRAFSPDKEEEADWLGGELLIPYDAAERAALNDWDDEQGADAYDVSVPLARMRMNYSGARRVVANKRAYRSRDCSPYRRTV
jgi:IrrE N-terminal-like domain